MATTEINEDEQKGIGQNIQIKTSEVLFSAVHAVPRDANVLFLLPEMNRSARGRPRRLLQSLTRRLTRKCTDFISGSAVVSKYTSIDAAAYAVKKRKKEEEEGEEEHYAIDRSGGTRRRRGVGRPITSVPPEAVDTQLQK